jgi:hypothetical protein
LNDEPKRMIVLGSVIVPDDGATVAFSIPDNLAPDEIRAILERVEAKRAADAAIETARLHQLFLGDEKDEPQ